MKTLAKQIGVVPAGMPMSDMPMHGSMDADANTLGLSMDAMGMLMNTSPRLGQALRGAFIDMMIPHHQGAIRMAHAELARGQNVELKAIAKRIVADQAREIGEMNDWRAKWYGTRSPVGGVPTA